MPVGSAPANAWTPETRPPGASRKGIPNKVTAELRDMIAKALDEAGGVEYLVQQAHANPQAFLSLLGKILPRDIHVSGMVEWREVLDGIAARAEVRRPEVAQAIEGPAQ